MQRPSVSLAAFSLSCSTTGSNNFIARPIHVRNSLAAETVLQIGNAQTSIVHADPIPRSVAPLLSSISQLLSMVSEEI